MEKWKDHPPRDDGGGGLLSMAKASTSVSKGTQIVEVTVPGVNEVLSKALEEAQEGYKATLREAQAVMKDAKDDHKAAVRVACTHHFIHAHRRSCCIIKLFITNGCNKIFRHSYPYLADLDLFHFIPCVAAFRAEENK